MRTSTTASRHFTRLSVVTLALMIVSTLGTNLFAQSTGAAKRQRDAARGRTRLPGVTPEREAAVLTFVKQHHPELIRLLSYLRTNKSRQYQTAIRELARTVERLAQIHERDMERHDLELRAWKASSRIDVLTAQWQMEPSEALREKLRAALSEQAKVRKLFLEAERVRLAERLEKLDSQIKQLETRQKREIESRLRTLTAKPRKSDSAKMRGAKDRGQEGDTKNRKKSGEAS